MAGPSPVSAPGGLAQGLLRVASPPTQGASAGRSGGARQHPALCCAGAWHLRHAPPPTSVGAGRPAGQPSPPRALPGPGGPARQDAAHIQSPQDLRAGADGGTAPPNRACTVHAPEKVDVGDPPSPAHGRRRVVSRRGAGSVCASRGWVVHGQPSSAERVPQALAMAIGQRQPTAGFVRPDGPWQSVWG